MSTPTPEEQARAVRGAVLAGRKIEAIKIYREQTGLGLAEAKQAVETLERQLRQEEAASVAVKMPGPGAADQTQQIIELLFAGRKIEAIKVYRTQTGAGLKEAKDAVENLEAELRISSPGFFAQKSGSGCASV